MSRSSSSAPRRGFTLVEMLVVLTIIALVLTMAVPGFVRAWQERKSAQAVTIMQGVLGSARARAARGNEEGLFFYLDPVTGRQMIAPIVPDPPNDDPDSHEYQYDCRDLLSADDPITDCITDLMAANRFRVTEGRIYSLPVPLRVSPADIVDVGRWSEKEIAVETFNQAPADGWPSGYPRHRNFFTIVFGPNGELIAGRGVLIHDLALQKEDSPGDKFTSGLHTKLPVSDPTDYYLSVPGASPATSTLDAAGNRPLYDIVSEMDSGGQPTSNAINFPSVAGVLVYDGSALADIPYEEGQESKRAFLEDQGQPIYIAPQTGDVLMGPKGENS